jgi:hypothetical protein
MNPTFKEGQEPRNLRYQSHFDLMQKYKEQFLIFYAGAIVFFVLSFWVAKIIRDARMSAALATNP